MDKFETQLKAHEPTAVTTTAAETIARRLAIRGHLRRITPLLYGAAAILLIAALTVGLFNHLIFMLELIPAHTANLPRHLGQYLGVLLQTIPWPLLVLSALTAIAARNLLKLETIFLAKRIKDINKEGNAMSSLISKVKLAAAGLGASLFAVATVSAYAYTAPQHQAQIKHRQQQLVQHLKQQVPNCYGLNCGPVQGGQNGNQGGTGEVRCYGLNGYNCGPVQGSNNDGGSNSGYVNGSPADTGGGSGGNSNGGKVDPGPNGGGSNQETTPRCYGPTGFNCGPVQSGDNDNTTPPPVNNGDNQPAGTISSGPAR